MLACLFHPSLNASDSPLCVRVCEWREGWGDHPRSRGQVSEWASDEPTNEGGPYEVLNQSEIADSLAIKRTSLSFWTAVFPLTNKVNVSRFHAVVPGSPCSVCAVFAVCAAPALTVINRSLLADLKLILQCFPSAASAGNGWLQTIVLTHYPVLTNRNENSFSRNSFSSPRAAGLLFHKFREMTVCRNQPHTTGVEDGGELACEYSFNVWGEWVCPDCGVFRSEDGLFRAFSQSRMTSGVE